MLKIQRLIVLLIPTLTFANNGLNLQLPSAPSNYSSDEVRTTDNMSCKNAITGTTQLELGMTGIVNNAGNIFDDSPDETKDIGVYARIIMPIGKVPERINCNTLYRLELHKRRLEIMKLEKELKKLQELQFINKDEKTN